MIKMNKTVIYSRVSTDEQDYTRQTAELKTYAAAYSLEVIGIFEEKKSGKNLERPELTKMLQLVADQKVNHVLTYELSRLGRSTADVLQITDKLTEHKCSLHIKNLSLITLDADLKVSAQTTFFLTMLAAVATLERHTIRDRMKSGYDHYLKKGGKVGRSVGYSKPIDQMNYFAEIKRELRAALSIRKTQKQLKADGKKVSIGSVSKVRNYLIQTKQLTA